MNAFPGSLTEHAYLSIRDRILRGELPFGAPLPRRVLAEEMGISMVPVGDALVRLESEGLVESRPRVGTRVCIPTPQAIRGHYIVREALETQSARIFAEKASPGEREEIRRMASQLDGLYALTDAGDAARERMFDLHKFHMRFHLRVAECTGCDELCSAIEKNQILVFNWLYDTAAGYRQSPPGWHSELAVALTQTDSDAADAAMRRHTRYRMDEILQRIQPHMAWSETRLAAFPKQPRKKKIQD